MKRAFISLSLFLFLFSSFVSAQQVTKLYWEPAEPRVGDDIVVYAEIEGNVSSVTLKYCPVTNGTCFYPKMTYENGIWKYEIDAESGTKMTDGVIDIAIIVNGNVLKEDEIVVKEKSTPGFEMALALIALLFIAKIEIRK